MQPEIPASTAEINATVDRLKQTLAGQRALPDADWIMQSGPFRSVQHFFDSSFLNFRHLLYYTDLTPRSRVLDFGCGLARLAIPFSGYLDGGAYCGVDTDPDVIRRNRETFADLGNFEFRHVDIYSKRYNPTGRSIRTLKEARFDAPFDLVFLFSVFTHILPADVDPLVDYLASQLADGGEIFSTWFLLNDETRSAIDRGLSHRKFAHPYEGARIDRPDIPEAAVAYPEETALAAFRRAGFEARPLYGKWRGGHRSWLWQDAILARR